MISTEATITVASNGYVIKSKKITLGDTVTEEYVATSFEDLANRLADILKTPAEIEKKAE